MSHASVDLLRGPAEDVDPSPKKIFGVVTGTVGPMPDPLFQGRVQVMLHFLDALDMSAFARVATLSAGPLCGTYFVPQPNDEVLVAFEHGDPDHPIIIGSLWNLTAPPPLPTQLMMVKAIRTLSGNQIVFSDGPPSLTMQVAAPAAVPATPSGIANIVMTPAGIQISVPPTVIMITAAGISMQSGTNVITMTPGGIAIASASQVIINGASIRLNS